MRVSADQVGSSGYALLCALQRLDRLLEQAVAATGASQGPSADLEEFRGLYIAVDDVSLLLGRRPGEPCWGGGTGPASAGLAAPGMPAGQADDGNVAWL